MPPDQRVQGRPQRSCPGAAERGRPCSNPSLQQHPAGCCTPQHAAWLARPVGAPPEETGARPGSEQAAGQLAGTHWTGGDLGAPLPSVPAPGSEMQGPGLRSCLCHPWAQAWGPRSRCPERNGAPARSPRGAAEGHAGSMPQPARQTPLWACPVELQPSSGSLGRSRVCHGTLGTRSATLVQPLPARWTLKTVAGPREALGPLKP